LLYSPHAMFKPELRQSRDHITSLYLFFEATTRLL
jgi:hypothetical protein